jgi:hypothetical protein
MVSHAVMIWRSDRADARRLRDTCRRREARCGAPKSVHCLRYRRRRKVKKLKRQRTRSLIHGPDSGSADRPVHSWARGRRRRLSRGGDRRPAVLGSPEAGYISIRSIIDRLDCSFGDCDTDQQPGDGFDHRLGCETVAIGSSILMMLEEDLVVLGDQQAGDRIARDTSGANRLPRNS